MIVPFDASTVILLGCLAVMGYYLPLAASRMINGLAGGGGWVAVLAVRMAADGAAALDVAAALVLVWTGVGVGRGVIARRVWPAGAMAVALAVVTATGAYLRTYRLQEVLDSSERDLQPDVEYYRQQALRTANPFAAGHKSPLWPAVNAPIVRALGGTDDSMRVLSWCLGIAMLPLAGWSLGRLLHPLAGVLTAGMLAVEPYLIDLCCEGLREEAGVCLWMAVLFLLLAGEDRPWRSPAAGAAGGLLLLLRNTFVLPLLAMVIWAIVYRRWRGVRAAVAVLLPVVIVSPFYVNQYRTYGDAFALEKRDARYHANIEFQSGAPPGLAMPSYEAWRRDLYVGDPLSPLAYLFTHHTWGDVLWRQWIGTSRIVRGRPFESRFEPWWGLAGAAGVLASLAVRRARFAGLFVVSSSVGIMAHLMTVHPVELRLLVPVMVVWLGAAWWVIVSVAQVGLEQGGAFVRCGTRSAAANPNDEIRMTNETQVMKSE